MQSERLTAPDPTLVLLRTSDPDQYGLATYELHKEESAGAPVLVFDAPDNAQAQALVEAWHGNRKLFLKPSRFQWTETVAQKVADRQAELSRAMQTGDDAERDRALEALGEAEGRAKVVRDAVFNGWPAR